MVKSDAESRARVMEKSWNNPRAKSLHFPAFGQQTLFHRFGFFFHARRALAKKAK